MANIKNYSGNNHLLKIVTTDELINLSIPFEKCLIDIELLDINEINLYSSLPIAGFFSRKSISQDIDYSGIIKQGKMIISGIKDFNFLSSGDVIRVITNNTIIRLYKRGSNSNLLFLTERCNSRCIMCSQPPRTEDDSYLLDDAFDLIELIDKSESILGISGGEPTLYGKSLVNLINKCYEILPNTVLHILSNGRLFASKAWNVYLDEIEHNKVIWGIPLFSCFPEDHDQVTNSPYSYIETVNGLYNLASKQQSIELRVILIKPVIENLLELGYFISRSLPFISTVSFMGVEPIGFAKKNRNKIWIDPADYLNILSDTLYFLKNNNINCSIFNLPLCIMPETIRQFSEKSISDWKVIYLDECDGCKLLEECGGFFFSHNDKWKSRLIKQVKINEIS